MSRTIHRPSNIVLPPIYMILGAVGLTLPYLYDGWIEYAAPALLLPVFAHAAIKLIPPRACPFETRASAKSADRPIRVENISV